jgi:hypothetical protein
MTSTERSGAYLRLIEARATLAAARAERARHPAPVQSGVYSYWVPCCGYPFECGHYEHHKVFRATLGRGAAHAQVLAARGGYLRALAAHQRACGQTAAALRSESAAGEVLSRRPGLPGGGGA